MAHEYVSPYCHHGLHKKCGRMECHICDEPCRCACHYAAETRSGTGEISVQQKVEEVDRYAREHKAEHCPNCHSSMSFVSALPGGERLMQCRECGRVAAISV